MDEGLNWLAKEKEQGDWSGLGFRVATGGDWPVLVRMGVSRGAWFWVAGRAGGEHGVDRARDCNEKKADQRCAGYQGFLSIQR
jgi:hypothetical protein